MFSRGIQENLFVYRGTQTVVSISLLLWVQTMQLMGTIEPHKLLPGIDLSHNPVAVNC